MGALVILLLKKKITH